MDIFATILANDEKIDAYIEKHYGDVPRIRGVRFMKTEKAPENIACDDYDNQMFAQYAGKDVVYIRTRCGDCGLGYENEDSNYIYCGGKDWEDKHKDLFLDHVTEDFDSTYCVHYFNAVVDEEYKEIIKELLEIQKRINEKSEA